MDIFFNNYINIIMKKKIITSTIILLCGGLLTKFFSILIKIFMTRVLGINLLSLYMLILPTFSFFITLGQIGLPIILSRFVALNNKNNKELYFSVIPITFIINLLFSIIIIFSSSFISSVLLHNKNIKYGIIAIGLVIPFTTLSSICRSYFFGKEFMFPHVLSNIVENIIRLLFMIYLLPKIIYFDNKIIIFILISFNIISECISTLILFLFLPRNFNISIQDFKPNMLYIKELFRLSLPNVSGNLLLSFSYFLEPIVITNILLYCGYTNSYITREYGIITGYIIPFLLLPNFFTIAISQAIMPYITREYEKKNYCNVFHTILFISLVIIVFGIIVIYIFFYFGKELLFLIYKNNLGYYYLKILSPFFILQYLQSILTFSINGMGKIKDIFYLSLISSIVRILSIIVLSFFKIGIYSYVISIIINIIICFIFLVYRLFHYLK